MIRNSGSRETPHSDCLILEHALRQAVLATWAEQQSLEHWQQMRGKANAVHLSTS